MFILSFLLVPEFDAHSEDYRVSEVVSGFRNKLLTEPERLGKSASVLVLFNAVNVVSQNKIA